MKSLILVVLSVLTTHAVAGTCYVSSDTLSGKVTGIKVSNKAFLAVRHHGDGNHINRMILKSGKMSMDATYSCAEQAPLDCTLGDSPFQILFDGSNMKILIRKGQMAIGAFNSDEVELGITSSSRDTEINLLPATDSQCKKWMPYDDKIETFPNY